MFPPPSRACRLAVVTAVAGLALAACEQKAEPTAPPALAPPPQATAPTPTLPPPAVGRAELLTAFDASAAAYAAGRGDGDGLAGRRFAVRQAFGCLGAIASDAASPGVARWSRGADGKSIDLTLEPADWAGAPVMTAGEGRWEAVEGFWLSRPWLRDDGCPAPRAAAAPVSASPQTAGIASVFAHGGSRLGRRDGKAFAFTIRDAPDAAPKGYRLVIEGRFAAVSGADAIACNAGAADERPVCVAAAEIDRVAFETAEGEVLSAWIAG